MTTLHAFSQSTAEPPSNHHIPCNPQYRFHMIEVHILIIPRSQQISSLHGGLNLPTIQLHLGQYIEFLFSNIRATRQLIYEIRPDLTASGGVEIRVVETDVDAGIKGEIHHLDAVGCEDHDALEVLELAEEDYCSSLISLCFS
jgi:hypothetical protein